MIYNTLNLSNETWIPDSVYGPSSQVSEEGHLDLAYRGTGEKLTIWKDFYYYGLYRDQVLVEPAVMGHPRISTNVTNRRDIYTTWYKSYDLNGDSSNDEAVYVRELLP